MSNSRRLHLSATFVGLGCAAALSIGVAACGGGGEKQETIGLIIKRDTNPFFVRMKDVAQSTADDENVKLLTAAGKSDIDNASQVAALAKMTSEGAKGILITPADSTAVVPAIAKARGAGVTVIALDTPTRPRAAVNALFATDNLQAGELIGRYAKAKAVEEGIEPKIAMLDLAPGISSGEQRHDGFLKGFGIGERDPEIVGSVDTQGDEAKAKAGMTQLLEKDSGINVVYTVNEPAAFGAIAALKAAGRAEGDVIVVSVDGGCKAIKDGVRPGDIDATAQQYPQNMAREGVESLADAARGGQKPSGYLNTGVELITGDPVPGVGSRSVAFGVRNCWGDKL
jgi:fructose transport system substrate-binding protein